MSRPIVSMMHLTATTFLCLILQGCGSSGSGAQGDQVESFLDPVDASSLSAALITGSHDEDSPEFWQCALSDGNTLLSYRVFTEGTGVETDLNTPGSQSSFTWSAVSATSMQTTVDSTGAQYMFSNITFSGRTIMEMTVGEGLMLNCERLGGAVQSTPPVAPAGSNSLSYAGVVYPLTHGFEDVFSYRPIQQMDTHFSSNFDVADATFELQQVFIVNFPSIVTWTPVAASVWFRATIFSPNGENFESATFTFEPESTDPKGSSVAGKYFFQDGRFGIELDGDGRIDSDANEFSDVSAGTISVVRIGDARARMTFDLMLTNGVPLTGSFEGDFPVYERY